MLNGDGPDEEHTVTGAPIGLYSGRLHSGCKAQRLARRHSRRQPPPDRQGVVGDECPEGRRPHQPSGADRYGRHHAHALQADELDRHENGRWQEGLENYHPTSPGGVHTNTWKLGEFQAELYHKIADGDLVVENTYTTGWTLPDTITPGTTVQVPVTCNGKHVETYVGQATEKTWHAGSPESYGSTCFGLYVGADKSKGGGGYDISSLSDFDNQGYVELEVRRGAPVNKVLEIRVEYTCGDMVMGKVYYYER